METHQQGVLFLQKLLAMFGVCIFIPLCQHAYRRWKHRARQLWRWKTQQVEISIQPLHWKPVFGCEELDTARKTFEELELETIGEFSVAFHWIEKEQQEIIQNAPIASPNATPPALPVQAVLACRVFVNREVACVVTTRAYSPRPLPGKKQVTYVEHCVTSRAGDWSYTTSTSLGIQPAQLMQLPHALTLRLTLKFLSKQSPQEPLALLLVMHVYFRKILAEKAGLDWEAPHSVEQIMEEEREGVEQLRSFASRQSPLSLILLLWRLRRQKGIHWNGELTGKL